MLTLKNIYYSVGEFPLLDYVNLEVQEKERIALIGRNGQGKSTLFKILSQQIFAEGGEIIKAAHLNISQLAQELPPSTSMTVYENVAQGLQELSDLLIQYHKLITENTTHDERWMNQLTEIQHRIEQKEGWQIQQRIERVIHDLHLPAEKKMSDLSGGWRRRVALGQALVQEPDILLLDEPTNHLDLTAILWLEKMLLNYPKTIIFITHDRALLRKIATKIIELDRGKLTSYPPDYDLYLSRKEQSIVEEQRHNALFDKKLSDEEQWIRQGIKARRTRNEGRVRALKALREQRAQRRTLQEKPTFTLNDPVQAGKMVIQAENISFGYSDKPIINNFSFNIQRGDKIAIVGQNGSGKTTLIKLLIGQLTPTEGNIKHSPTNQIAFFDQTRAALVGENTVMENVAEGDDYIEIQGNKKHVIGYLGDFLFSPSKCRALVKTLSGGEQSRLFLAKLFSKPANILVLDEPTNDLDIESLNVLETLLLNYQGTVLIISHDREFIDNIATHCIALEENGNISVNVGGYTDWLERQAIPKKKTSEKKAAITAPSKSSPKKISLAEQKELKALPDLIEALEKDIQTIELQMSDPDFYKKEKNYTQKISNTLSQLKEKLAKAHLRWEELER